ncbi:MAG: NUDIX hydrolase [Phycisphaeraceae bacterium]
MTPTACDSSIQRRLMPAIAMARDPDRAGELKVTVSTVVCDGRRVLLVREGNGRKRGKWNLPGGKVQSGEKLVAAAVRETEEETGYLVKPVALVGLYINVRGERKPSLRLHLSAKVVDGEPEYDGDEILDVRWFTLAMLRDMPDRKLWNVHLLRRTLSEVDHEVSYPLRLLKEVDAALAVA